MENIKKPGIVWTILQGIQQLLACVGATVLGPVLMGIPANMALFTSGLGTIPYVLVTGIPILLGSSFAFISVIKYVMEKGSRAEVAAGIFLAGCVSILMGIYTKKKGTAWIRNVLPTKVNLNILIAIGQVLASIALMDITAPLGPNGVPGIWLGIASLLVFLFIALAFNKNHPVTGLPIFITMILLFVVSLIAGWVDTAPILAAPIFVLPEVFMPKFSILCLTIMIPTIATISENFGDVQAVGLIFKENLEDKMWLSYIFDGIADILSIFGNPSTPYNESIGAMQMAKNQNPSVTRAQFKWVVIVAAVLAIGAGFFGWVTPLVLSIPSPIVGGIFWIILGIISLLGLQLAKNSDVNFKDLEVQKVTIPMTMAWLLGSLGATYPLPTLNIGNTVIPIDDFGAIAVSALVGIVANQIRVKGKGANILVTALLSIGVLLWSNFGSTVVALKIAALILAYTIPWVYDFVIQKVKDFNDRRFQVVGAIVFTGVVVLIIQVSQLLRF